MALGNDVWRYSCSWQELFIKHNILWLGYAAWQGYLTHGRGVLRCIVTDAIPPLIDWQVKRVNFTHNFIPGMAIMNLFDELEGETPALAFLAEAVGAYIPHQELVLMVQNSSDIEIYCLRPKITVPECHQQVQQRWAEFQLDRRFYA